MTAQKLNSALIEVMREKLPPEVNLANMLMDVMCIGKEAVYRRLRGEVPFTLAEVALISRELNISLDRLIGTSASSSNIVFNLNIPLEGDPFDTYFHMLDRYVDIFEEIIHDSNSTLCSSSNIIPHPLLFKYPALSKFRLFKWMYQRGKSGQVRFYEDIVIPEKGIEKQKQFIRLAREFRKSYFIVDNTLFTSYIKDIKYFEDLNMITAEHIQELKREMIELLDEMEDIAARGTFPNGNDVRLYISNIDLEAAYGYFFSGNITVSLLRVYSVNSITSRDPKVFDSLRDWIESQKKFTTLISQSGEMQRIQFFNRQREAVNSI